MPDLHMCHTHAPHLGAVALLRRALSLATLTSCVVSDGGMAIIPAGPAPSRQRQASVSTNRRGGACARPGSGRAGCDLVKSEQGTAAGLYAGSSGAAGFACAAAGSGSGSDTSTRTSATRAGGGGGVGCEKETAPGAAAGAEARVTAS